MHKTRAMSCLRHDSILVRIHTVCARMGQYQHIYLRSKHCEQRINVNLVSPRTACLGKNGEPRLGGPKTQSRLNRNDPCPRLSVLISFFFFFFFLIFNFGF